METIQFKKDIVIVGGGPAGMAAALSAKENGVEDILIIERDFRLGGILDQCIHNGFGLHRFKEELTGPEYAEKYETMVRDEKIEFMVNTMVIDITSDKVITAVNEEKGFFTIKAKAVILAMGCRERTRGALRTAGTRPAGVYTAGTMQKLVNIKGYLPGKEIVILGSGDIGLIMARRMTLEGAKVKMVLEIMEDSGGLTRNIAQCLRDFDIPLKLNYTVSKIHGEERVTGVTIAQVDKNLKLVEGTEEYVSCDTLMLSVGLIPENELSKKAGITINSKTKGPEIDYKRETDVEGIFACGNVVKVHELVDFVSEEGRKAGKSAALFVKGKENPKGKEKEKSVEQKKGVSHLGGIICTICPNGCKLELDNEGKVIGNLCKRGDAFMMAEINEPVRTLTTIMMTEEGIPVPVKSNVPVPFKYTKEFMAKINSTSLMLPIHQGDIIIENIGNTDAHIVATRTIKK